MNYFEQFLAMLPPWGVSALFGALGGAIGALIGIGLSIAFVSPKRGYHAGVIGAILAVQLANHLPAETKASVNAYRAVNEAKEQRLFSLLFQYHPEAEVELHSKISKALAKDPNQQGQIEAQNAAREVMEKYFSPHINEASDEATYEMIRWQSRALETLKDKPLVCVNYYLGNVGLNANDLPSGFLDEELRVKANLLESSVTNPSKFKAIKSEAEFAEVITKYYGKNGYSTDGLMKIGEVATLPADEACKIVREFVGTLASMDQQLASQVMKTLQANSTTNQ